jgi:hypothetical protein
LRGAETDVTTCLRTKAEWEQDTMRRLQCVQ